MTVKAIAKNCSRCGRAFECGFNLDACWCSELRPLGTSQIDPRAGCLCRACLRDATADPEPIPSNEAGA